MKTITSCMAASLVLAAIVASPAASAAPSGVLNKSITVSFSANGVATGSDGASRSFSTAVTRTIYISSAGRLFMRHVASNGRATRGGDFDPNDKRQGRGSFHFEGNRLVGVLPYAAGARQITITFDSAFSSCTARIIEGHAAGGVIQRKGPNGIMYKITSASTSAPECSVRDGNIFAH